MMKEIPLTAVTDNNLLIRIHPEGVFYAIMDENEQVVLQQMISMPAGKFKDVDFLKHFFDQPELRVHSENISIVFENSNYMLIPNDIFRNEDVKKLYEIEFGKKEKIELKFNLLPQWGAHLVFRTENYLTEFLEKKYPNAEIEHHIFNLLRKKIKKNVSSVYANLRKECVDIIVVKNSKLLIVNSFEAKSEQDIVYFVLNIYEQLELDIETFPLKLFSEKSISSSLLELLKQYIRKVE